LKNWNDPLRQGSEVTHLAELCHNDIKGAFQQALLLSDEAGYANEVIIMVFQKV